MRRWLLLLPFLLLPLACDDNQSTPIMPTSVGGGTTTSCEPSGGNCVSDADCCSGLSCEMNKHVCEGAATCFPSSHSCGTSSDCCGGLVCGTNPAGAKVCREDQGAGGGGGGGTGTESRREQTRGAGQRRP